MSANILLKVDAQIETYIKEVLVTTKLLFSHIFSVHYLVFLFCVFNRKHRSLKNHLRA